MNITFEWQPCPDGAVLRAVLPSGWSLTTVAVITTFETGTIPASLEIYGWGNWDSPSEPVLIPCRSVEEAGLVCRAMLDLRGVNIPLPVFKTDDPIVYIKTEES